MYHKILLAAKWLLLTAPYWVAAIILALKADEAQKEMDTAFLAELRDMPVLGIPLIWYVGFGFLACMTCMAWIVTRGYLQERKRMKSTN